VEAEAGDEGESRQTIVAESMTQNIALLEFLETHQEGITRLEAMRDLGIMNLWARIAELERLGINITHTPATVPTRNSKTAHVMRYTLDNHFAIG
jgi:hypothetical protein